MELLDVEMDAGCPVSPDESTILNGGADHVDRRRKVHGGFREGFKRFLHYCGPGYMVAVGYLDPGNWATDIEAGSRFGYDLLFIILISNLMAMVLQHLCVLLGLGTKQDLAQACRRRLPPWANLPMYLLAEVAIISCDLAEVLGTAIAIKLLFGVPIFYGVLITIADVIIILCGVLDGRGFRLLESIVLVLFTLIGACFLIEIYLVKPDWSAVFLGLLPLNAVKLMATDHSSLVVALGIIGATVMPHNLYLHSAIVQSRSLPDRDDFGDVDCGDCRNSMVEERDSLGSQIKYATLDSTLALFLAFFINAAILIVSAAAFNSRGYAHVRSIEDASDLVRDWLGPFAGILFGSALLAAGQSSTLTGTMAGQIVFEGHLSLNIPYWARRLLTRSASILPALVIIWFTGDESINELLVWSQVILSLQLPFAIVPLILFTLHRGNNYISSPTPSQTDPRCGQTSRWLRILAWMIAIVLIALNVTFIINQFL